MNETEITQRITKIIDNIRFDRFTEVPSSDCIRKAVKVQLRKLALEYKQKAQAALDPLKAVNLQVMALQVEQTVCRIENGEFQVNIPTLEGQE